jgi:hypothetical protein
VTPQTVRLVPSLLQPHLQHANADEWVLALPRTLSTPVINTWSVAGGGISPGAKSIV